MPTNPHVVLITHHHGDHLDPEALDQIDRMAAVIAPPGRCARAASRLGFDRVLEARPGAHLAVAGVAVDVVRGKHNVPEVCYRVERNGRAVFFGGDTMLTPEIERLAERKPTPFVVLPGERSSLLGRRFVMTPEESIGLARRFGAERAVLSHHEIRVARRWPFGWMVSVPPPDPADFPDWFTIPSPGDHVAFPWETTR